MKIQCPSPLSSCDADEDNNNYANNDDNVTVTVVVVVVVRVMKTCTVDYNTTGSKIL